MIPIRLLSSAALFAALALAIGCGKKTDPQQEPGPKPGAPNTTAPVEIPAAKAEAAKRLQQIGVALHKFEKANGYFPAGITAPRTEVGLGWRVQILPYLDDPECAELYKQFKLDEAWNSEHNKPLVAKMPKVFESPANPAAVGETYIQSFYGDNGFLRPANSSKGGKGKTQPTQDLPPGTPIPGRKIADITDGTSNTLMAAETPLAVEWSKADDIAFVPFGARPPTPKLGGPFNDGFHGLMCDGSVHFFPSTLGDKTLVSMVTIHGGEILPAEVTAILFPPDQKKGAVPKEVPGDLPDAAARKTAVGNYQKIVKALHEYHDAFNYLPAGIATDKAVGLSWRVQILPNLGEEALYKEFKLTEPWDSEHNKKLIDKMPKVFESAGKSAPKGQTFLRTTQGHGGIIPVGQDGKPQLQGRQPGQILPGRPLIAGIPDGTSNTILLVETAAAVPWTKPEELVLPDRADLLGQGSAPKTPKIPPLGGPFADGFHAVMGDGQVTFYKTGYPVDELAKLFSPNDGLVVVPLGTPEKIGYSVPLPVAPGGNIPQKGGTKTSGPPMPPK